MPKPKVKNAFDHNHIMATLKRSTSEWSYTLNIHATGQRFPGTTGKVYIINP